MNDEKTCSVLVNIRSTGVWADSRSTNNLHPLSHRRALHLFSVLSQCVWGSIWKRRRKTAVKAHSPLLVLVDRCEGVESKKNSQHPLLSPPLTTPPALSHTFHIYILGLSIHGGLVTLEIWRTKGKMFLHQLPKPPWSRLSSAAALGVKGQCSFHVWSVILSTLLRWHLWGDCLWRPPAWACVYLHCSEICSVIIWQVEL